MVRNFFIYLSIFGIITGLEARTLDAKSKKLKLVIDHDGGADDAMAVIMSILYEKYFHGPEIVALTTTHGNVNESQVFINSQRFLDMTGRRDVPIYRGATRALLIPEISDFYFGYDGLGDIGNLSDFKPIKAQKEHAAFGLIQLSKKHEGELVIMAIGPQTNIALAQRLDPGFIGRLSQLYVGAGHIYSGVVPEPEFNALMDVEAYRIVADSAHTDKVTLLPFSQIMTSLNLTRDWRQNVLGSINTPLMRALNSFERLSQPLDEMWTLLDPAVAAIVLDNDLVDEFKYGHNNIILCDAERGINTNKIGTENANARLVYSAKEEYYKKFLLDVFSAELNVCVKK